MTAPPATKVYTQSLPLQQIRDRSRPRPTGIIDATSEQHPDLSYVDWQFSKMKVDVHSTPDRVESESAAHSAIRVQGLPPDISQDQLRKDFWPYQQNNEEIAQISRIQIIPTQLYEIGGVAAGGRSAKAIIQFNIPRAAAEARARFHHASMYGRNLNISAAPPCLLVGGIDAQIINNGMSVHNLKQALEQYFRPRSVPQAGNTHDSRVNIRLLVNDGQFTGHALVCFNDPILADLELEAHKALVGSGQNLFNGKPVFVRYARGNEMNKTTGVRQPPIYNEPGQPLIVGGNVTGLI